MRSYLIKRLLLVIPTVLLVSVIVFLLVRLIPGNIIDQMQIEFGGRYGDEPAQRAAIEHALGLDVPVYVQYGRWIAAIVLHGDLGTSLFGGKSVTGEILQRLPVSFELGFLGILVGLIIALPIGIYSAVRQNSLGDYAGRNFAIACISIPYFWLGAMVMLYPSIWWGWSPPMVYIPFSENPGGNLAQFIIPAAIMGMALSGVTMRMTRTMMLEVLRQDYIRTAWAKGLRERTVVMRHAIKNALIPVVTIAGLFLPIMIGGTVVIEQIFNLPGLGRLILDSLGRRDYTMVSGINLFIASAVIVVNLVVDLTYAYLDPRIRYR